MSNAHGLTKENLLFTFPVCLRENPSIAALGDVTAEVLAKRPAEIGLLSLYPRIDELPEDLLDILAYDFKVDWWDPEYTLEEKRQTLKASWRVHKLLGTKAAVEIAISAIYPGTKVLEWFEYGGEPYHFRLDINITNDSIDSEKQRRVLERVNFYKSLRSHNDGVTYFVEARPAAAKTEARASGIWESVHTKLELPVPPIRSAVGIHVGATAGLSEYAVANVELPIPIQAVARSGITTILREEYATQFALPDGQSPTGQTQIRVTATSTWQECYMTGAAPLMDQA